MCQTYIRTNVVTKQENRSGYKYKPRCPCGRTQPVERTIMALRSDFMIHAARRKIRRGLNVLPLVLSGHLGAGRVVVLTKRLLFKIPPKIAYVKLQNET
ncbi:hypothetical protein AVEN_3916-1 [Araneus ventricosus]|uniref:Uncharacterized protein n=1 Tax=Araneus ventricosus TaxID=182803 RepID=A0A4Y2IHU1_ARAVE|nr:hypothetical protein AVEN_3916-1 [Araneus ventricosus]